MHRQPLTGWRAGTSILRVAGLVGLVMLVVIVAFAGVVGGANSAVSALTGASVVFVVMMAGIVGISIVVAGDANLSMAGAATVYIGQIILIVAALLVLRNQEWMVGRAFAIGAIAQVLAMQVAQVIGYNRGRHLVATELPGAPGAGSSTSLQEDGR